MPRITPLALLALAFATCSARAEEAEKDWSHHTGKISFLVGYSKAVAEAKFSGKPILAFCTTTWCGYCKKLAEESFNDDQVIAAVSDFIPVIVDGDVEKDVCTKFGVNGYPNVRFLSSEEKVLGEVGGYVPAKEFLASIKAARAKLKECKPSEAYAKLLKARKDLDRAMEKKNYATALAAVKAIEKVGHKGAESQAAAKAKEEITALAKAALEQAEALVSEGKKAEAQQAFEKAAQAFKGLPEAEEALKRTEALKKELPPPK